MTKSLSISVLAAAFIFFNAFAVCAQRAAQYRLSVGFASSLVSNKEQFEFTLGGEKIVLNSNNPRVYFNKKFAAGDRYKITQTAGARACNFSQYDPMEGVFADRDIELNANCLGQLTLFKFEISGIEQGETFKFADNYRRTFSTSFSVTANIGGFPQGDDYVFSQTDGPRPCRMTLNQGVVPTAPLTINADCRKNPTPTTPTPTPPTSGDSFKDFELVSRSSDDKIFGTFYEAWTPVIGGTGADEGRYIAYVTYTKGLGGGSGKYRQVVWRDRKTGETRLVSQSNGVEGNQNSGAPAISADGKSVAFESYATNLTPDTNNVRDVFVWNYDTNTVTAVSENRGIEANSECFEPTISADGNLVAFTSSADNLAPGVAGTSTVNVYLRDMRSGAVTLISKQEKDGKAGGGSRPSISEDGSRIAFYNYFPLTKEDKNDLWDIYVWQSGMPNLKRISKTAAGADKDQGDESASRVVSPAISGNGRFVAFATTATNMITNDTNKLQDVFVVEIDSGRIVLLSLANGALGDGDSPAGQGEKIALTSDGKQALFSTKAMNLGGSLVLQSLIEGANPRAIVPSKIDGVTTSVTVPAISQTGKCVIFGSNAKLDKRFPSSGIFVACR